MEMINEEDKELEEYYKQYLPRKYSGMSISKCPFCEMERLGVFISLNNPSFIACNFCNKIITEIEIKDMSKLI
jgi:hypothetical protein